MIDHLNYEFCRLVAHYVSIYYFGYCETREVLEDLMRRSHVVACYVYIVRRECVKKKGHSLLGGYELVIWLLRW